jgi:hypothetical protein
MLSLFRKEWTANQGSEAPKIDAEIKNAAKRTNRYVREQDEQVMQ